MRNGLIRFSMYIIFVLLPFPTLFSQSVNGVVSGADNASPLIGANVSIGNLTTITDENGRFEIEASVGDTLKLTYIGYDDFLRIVDESLLQGDHSFSLVYSNSILNTATITTSRFSRNLSEAVVSIDVLKPNLVKNTNTVAIDDVLDKVPGVQMVDGQANIRGGSGYSYGAGSRVMLLLDNLPALQSDAGFPNWDDLPVEDIGQVEVVKGAASSIYGSSALNGIINVRRKRPSIEPETEVALGYNYFMDPKDPKKKWWTNEEQPRGINLSLVHRRKVDKLDLSFGGLYYDLQSFNKDTYKTRYRVFLNLNYQLNDRISLGLNTLFNNTDNGSFFVWASPVTGAYQPFPGSQATANSTRYMIDPSITFNDSNGGVHKLLTRYLSINNDNNMDQSNASVMYYGEYQYQKRLESFDAVVTMGGVYATTDTDAELFGDTIFSNSNSALYIQLEKELGELTLSGGARIERNEHRSPASFMGQIIPDGKVTDSKPIFRLGANYKLHEFSAVRINWGQGYRFPTITERFITTNFAGFMIFPNVNLLPESGWSSEIGIKQGVKALGFKGFIDVSAFWSEYQDMMEFTLVNMGGLGFQSQNVGNTRIRGAEISIFGEINFLGIPVNVFGGATILDPVYKDFTEALQSSSSSSENILKYRSRNNYKLDAEAFYQSFSFGIAFLHSSHVEAIDSALELLPGAGIADYRSVNNQGFKRFDTRLSYSFQNFKVSAVVNNILNEEYSLRPALLEAPRNIAVRMDLKI